MKRIISLLLALVLAAGIMSVAANAEEYKRWEYKNTDDIPEWIAPTFIGGWNVSQSGEIYTISRVTNIPREYKYSGNYCLNYVRVTFNEGVLSWCGPSPEEWDETIKALLPGINYAYSEPEDRPSFSENYTKAMGYTWDDYINFRMPGYFYSARSGSPEFTIALTLFSIYDDSQLYRYNETAFRKEVDKILALDCVESISIFPLKENPVYYLGRQLTEKECTSGDVNGDGKVNAKDVTVLMKYIMNGNKPENFDLVIADFNQDGKINAKDSLNLIIAIADKRV